MKINRFIALAIIALLIVGAMGFISYKVFAQVPTPPTQAPDCSQQDDNSAEVKGAPDADNVDLQCGDQNAPDGQEAKGVESLDVESADGQESAPQGTPAISADQAQQAALAVHSGTVVKTELDNENSKLVYSVEFNDGADVKVDAMNGAVLSMETGQN